MSASMCPTIPVLNFATSLSGLSMIQQTVSWDVNVCGSSLSLMSSTPAFSSPSVVVSISTSTPSPSPTSPAITSVSTSLSSIAVVSSSTSSSLTCPSGLTASQGTDLYFQAGTINGWTISPTNANKSWNVIDDPSIALPPSNYYLQWRMYNGVSAFFHVYAPVCYPQTYTQTMWFGLQYATSPSNCTLQLCAVGSAFGGTCTALLPITNTGFNPYIWNFTTTSSTWSSSRWLLSGTLNCPAGGPVNGNYAYLNYFVTAGMEIQPGYPS